MLSVHDFYAETKYLFFSILQMSVCIFFGCFMQENTRNVFKCPFDNFCSITFDKNSVCVSVERGKVGFTGRAFKT